MKNKLFLLTLFVLFTRISVFSENGTASLTPGTAQAGQDIAVPLMVTNFNSVSALTIYITFDPAFVTPKLNEDGYVILTNLPQGFSGSFYGILQGGNTVVITFFNISSWFTVSNGKLLDINFTALCTPGVSPLNFIMPGCDVQQFFPPVPIFVTYTSGSVTVQNSYTTLTKGNVTASPASVCYGNSSTLTATPPTGGNPLSYQYYWEQSTDGGTVWSAIPGATSLTYVATGIVTNTHFHQVQTSSLGICGVLTVTTDPVAVTLIPPSSVNPLSNQFYCHGAVASVTVLSGPAPGTVFSWTNSNPAVGLGASGTGDVPSFTAINGTSAPITALVTVIPTLDGCTGVSASYTITVNPNPTVTPVNNQTKCSGAPTVAVNFTGTVTGTVYNWTNANTSIGLASSGSGNIPSFTTVNNGTMAATATITVTPSFTYGGITCTGPSNTFFINVNPVPSVNPLISATYCNGTVVSPTVVSGPVTGTTYSWTNNNPAIGLGASGTGNIPSFTATSGTGGPLSGLITIVPTFNSCTGASAIFTITVNPVPTVNAVNNQNLCHGSATAAVNFSGAVSGADYNWTNSNTSIGLASSGTGNIPSFGATNTGTSPVTATITVTPSFTNGGIVCTGSPIDFFITVNPAPSVNPVSSQVFCSGALAPETALSGPISGTTFGWSNNLVAIGLGSSGTGNIPEFTAANPGCEPIAALITIIPSYNGCNGTPAVYTITVNPVPTVVSVNNQEVCHNTLTAAVNFTSPVPGTVFNWTNSDPSIGLADSGNGNIGAFTAINAGSLPVTATITITPSFTGSGTTCTGSPMIFTIVVLPMPAAAGSISGPTSVQQGQTGFVYSIPVIAGATGYAWTLPEGATIVSGANSNIITVDFSITAQSGVMRVVGTSPCGNSMASPDHYITLLPFIPANIEVINLIIANGQTECYNASQTITVAGNGNLFIVLNGGSATFIAGEKIVFLPGTTVFNGGYLLGKITTNGQYCNQTDLPMVATVKEETGRPAVPSMSPKIMTYPNPTSGLITLDLTGVDVTFPTQVEIYRMTGERVVSETITGESRRLFSLEGQPAGIYLIRAVNHEGTWTFKIIKK